MSYQVPSVLVSQQLLNSGGVSSTTPDLEACIIGPAYNNLYYVAGSLASQISTAVTGSVSTTGTIAAGAYTLTVVSTGGLNVGSTVIVVGAGGTNTNLQAIIQSIAGNVITLDTAATVGVTGAAVFTPGYISNSLVDNTFNLGGQIAGQVITPSSINMWLNNAQIQTVTSGFAATPNSNVLTMVSASTTGSITAASNSLTVASATGLEIGDEVTIVGAGTAGATLTATINNISGTTITLGTAAVTTVTSQAVTKVNPVNLNPVTNTLNSTAGDVVKLTYTDLSLVAHVFTSTIQSVTTSSGLNGTIVSYSLTDSLPSSAVMAAQTVLVTVLKTFNDQQIPATNPLTLASNYDTSTVGTTGQITVKAGVSLVYGKVINGYVYAGYQALRTDLSGSILTFNDITDLEAKFTDLSDANPLGLAVQLALANTTGRIRAIAVSSNDLTGHTAALTTAQGLRLYYLVPLTQDPAILQEYSSHCTQMSTPQNAAWRIAFVNTAQPTIEAIGQYTATSPNSNGGANATALVGSTYVLTASNATFITDGVLPGDVITFTAATATPTQVGAHAVVSVISNQQLVVNTTAPATAISYYITRSMSKTETATAVAAVSSGFNNKRITHVQPDLAGVSISGVTKYVPGYYLAAALAGLASGSPVQQGFTNVGIAGIEDLKDSNFWFAKADLNTMAAAGTLLYVQDTAGGVPYCRHELTTDMSVLNNRELLKVKEIDFLSYFYYDKIKSFIGSWNITSSSINTLRQTLVASSELLKSQSLPKIGPVLLSYNIVTLIQDPVNTDTIDCTMTVAVGTPMNYVDITLEV